MIREGRTYAKYIKRLGKRRFAVSEIQGYEYCILFPSLVLFECHFIPFDVITQSDGVSASLCYYISMFFPVILTALRCLPPPLAATPFGSRRSLDSPPRPQPSVCGRQPLRSDASVGWCRYTQKKHCKKPLPVVDFSCPHT